MGDLADNAEIEVDRINAEALARQKARQARIEESMRPRAPGAATDCDDCGAPLFPDSEGELVHAEMPEEAASPSPHLH